MISVVIIDDHRAFSQAVGLALSLEPDLTYVGEASTMTLGLDLIARTRPAVALVDYALPDVDGVETTRRIRRSFPATRVVMITGHADLALMQAAADAGASAFLPKQSAVAEIIRAVRHADDGIMLVDHGTLRLLMVDSGSRSRMDTRGLNERELEALEMLGRGLSPRGIAEELCVSLHTARGYVKAILAKLEAHSQLEAVVAAIRLGLIEAPSPPLVSAAP